MNKSSKKKTSNIKNKTEKASKKQVKSVSLKKTAKPPKKQEVKTVTPKKEIKKVKKKIISPTIKKTSNRNVKKVAKKSIEPSVKALSKKVISKKEVHPKNISTNQKLTAKKPTITSSKTKNKVNIIEKKTIIPQKKKTQSPPPFSPKSVSEPKNTTEKQISFLIQHKPNQIVCIAGSFNQWNPTRHKLEEIEPGLYKVEISLTPGSYQYKYVVNDRWEVNPNSPSVTNELGTLNNLILVD